MLVHNLSSEQRVNYSCLSSMSGRFFGNTVLWKGRGNDKGVVPDCRLYYAGCLPAGLLELPSLTSPASSCELEQGAPAAKRPKQEAQGEAQSAGQMSRYVEQVDAGQYSRTQVLQDCGRIMAGLWLCRTSK